MGTAVSRVRAAALRSIQSARVRVYDLNRRAGRFSEVIWLVGEGRSGTTWVASLIGADCRYRQMHEPMHWRFVPDSSFIGSRPYRRPDQEDVQLEAALKRVFSGTLTAKRVDYGNYRLFYRGLIVKDIDVILLMPWVYRRFPHVKPILLVRNPFAVARSRKAAPMAGWPKAPAAELLEQPLLVSDHLAGHAKLLQRVVEGGNFIVNHVAAWAAMHYVAFRTIDRRKVHVLLYEDVLSDPASAMRGLDAFLGRATGRSTLDQTRVLRPSRVSSESSVAAARQDPARAWRRGITANEIADGLEVLDAFGLGGLYDGNGQPVRKEFERLLCTREGEE